MLEHGSKVRIVFVMLSVILQLNRRMTILIEASYEYGDGQKCQFVLLLLKICCNMVVLESPDC